MNDQAPSAIDKLRKRVAEDKTREFPDEPVSDPELDEVRVLLKEYARFVSSQVIKVIQGGTVDVYMEQTEPDLNVHLSALHQNKPDSLKKIIERYRQVKERLDETLDLAVQASRERQQPG